MQGWVDLGTMVVNSLPKTATQQRRDCDSNPCSSEPESGTLATRPPMPRPLTEKQKKNRPARPFPTKQHVSWFYRTNRTESRRMFTTLFSVFVGSLPCGAGYGNWKSHHAFNNDAPKTFGTGRTEWPMHTARDVHCTRRRRRFKPRDRQTPRTSVRIISISCIRCSLKMDTIPILLSARSEEETKNLAYIRKQKHSINWQKTKQNQSVALILT